MDTVDRGTRSKNMSAIHSKNTKPEVFLRKLLFKEGFRYKLHDKKIPGTPDLYLKKYNCALFVHGCFWHRHKGCKLAYTPKSNIEFWDKKFQANIIRDQHVLNQLYKQNIRVIIVWECTIKKMIKNLNLQTVIINEISNCIRSGVDSLTEF